VRSVNEDSVFFFHLPSSGSEVQDSALALVADGMGGATGGSIASRIASRTIPQTYVSSGGNPAKALRNAMDCANKEIYRRSQQDTALAGMGATCVALVLTPSCAWAAWVGDSRLYLIRDGQIFQMTEDHSVVQEMVRRGILSTEAAASHEERNVITRALGSQRKVEIAVWEQPFPVKVQDRLLLSSDGLHDALSSPDILEIAGGTSLEEACSALVEEANNRGGYDNISAVLTEIVEPRPAQSLQPHVTRDYRQIHEVNS